MLDNFRRGHLLTANEIPAQRRGTRSSLGATFEAADKFGWTLIHPLAASANPSGIVTHDAFETLCGLLLEGANGGIDGALLHLHGAMVAEGFEDGEGLRAIIGPDVPVVVEFTWASNGPVAREPVPGYAAALPVRVPNRPWFDENE
jgi:microcystin degradation protein MlrC